MAAPMRVGVLNDMSEGPPGPADIERWLRLGADELLREGRIDREVEFVHAHGLGLPSGTAAAVERGYCALVEQDVLLIVGPAIGDNALVATPLADRHRVPTLNWAGAERARSEYMFHLQVGSHEDESIVLARYLASLGVEKVGVVYDRSPIGRRHLLFLQAEADVVGLRLAATTSVQPLVEDAAAAVDSVLEGGVDALVYLGLGLSAPAVARALTARRWVGLRAMNAAGLRGYDPEFARIIDGWTYVDIHSDDNTTLAALRRRLGGRLESRPTRSEAKPSEGPVARARANSERESPAELGSPSVNNFVAASGYDLGRLVAEGLARAPERTREGIKEGLEQVKWLPAAEGHEGTLLGFGKHDRGALHGRYLVLRQWLDGKSVELKDSQIGSSS